MYTLSTVTRLLSSIPGSTDLNLIYEDILSTGRDPADIGLVILTHAHPDHTGSAKVIRDLTSCMVAAHPSDAPFIEQVDPAMLKSPAPGIPPMVKAPVPVGRFLNEGDSINLGKGLTLEVSIPRVIHQNPFPCSFREESALFTGDTVQAPGRAPIYTDPVALVRSLRRLMDISGIRHYLPSHDMPAEGL